MKTVAREVVDMLLPIKPEGRYRLMTDVSRESSLETRVGELVWYCPPGETRPLQAVVRFMGEVRELGMGTRLGLQVIVGTREVDSWNSLVLLPHVFLQESDWYFGETDGRVDGVRYFTVDENKGVFCHVGQVTRIQVLLWPSLKSGKKF